MDAFTIFTLATSGYFVLESIPLLVSPKLVVTLASPASRTASITDFEAQMCRALALALLTLAALSLLLSGLVPLTTLPTPALDAAEESSPSTTTAYATPALVILTTRHTAAAVFTYTQIRGGGASVTAAMVSGGLACLGLWCLLFLGGAGSNKDRRSGWLFPSEEKQAERRERRERRSTRLKSSKQN